MNMVQDLGISKITVEREGAGNVMVVNPIDQIAGQHRVIPEGDLQAITQILFLEAVKIQGIMFATGADVIDKDIVVGDLIAVFGVIPKPTGVLDVLTVVVDEDVIDRDDPLFTVP